MLSFYGIFMYIRWQGSFGLYQSPHISKGLWETYAEYHKLRNLNNGPFTSAPTQFVLLDIRSLQTHRPFGSQLEGLLPSLYAIHLAQQSETRSPSAVSEWWRGEKSRPQGWGIAFDTRGGGWTSVGVNHHSRCASFWSSYAVCGQHHWILDRRRMVQRCLESSQHRRSQERTTTLKVGTTGWTLASGKLILTYTSSSSSFNGNNRWAMQRLHNEPGPRQSKGNTSKSKRRLEN